LKWTAQQVFEFNLKSAAPNAESLSRHDGSTKKLFSNAQRNLIYKSKQGKGILPFHLLDSLHLASYLLGLVGCMSIIITTFRGRGDWKMTIFALLILAFIVTNAAICGGLSIVYGRYQLRVLWLSLAPVL